MAERVVTSPIKVDLHIHSAASSHKDGSKVSSGTIDNIQVLVERLEHFGLNAVSITDHDLPCMTQKHHSVLNSKGC